MMAWQSTRDTVSLRYANNDERFSLLWKLVFNFLEKDVDESLQQALSFRRRRAHLRSRGFLLLNRFLNCVSLSSVKREIVTALVPAISWSKKEASSGIAPDMMVRLRPCGEKISSMVRNSFRELYQTLIRILETPKKSGSYLIQAVLHAFSLKYSEEDFKIAISLKIFPVLNKLLLTDITQKKEENKEEKKSEIGQLDKKIVKKIKKRQHKSTR
eukprot:TRINITY_DN2550_c0_g1_i1.p1 TRINITY_DN2550_c0_g1~~TRINITY_DN2550_c0_g1_i1.p1  ORF type:complete len:214 (-),score=18.88 TRINITY_DN2550_c0_g1_i1:24-665(-)